jgi:integrase
LEIGLEIETLKNGENAMKRMKTNYPGVFYREAKRLGGKGLEKVYYIVFKKDGKVIEEKAGRQFADAMTPAKAALIRGERIEGKRLSPKEIRAQTKKAIAYKWTIDRLYEEYKRQNPQLKGWKTYNSQYELWLKPAFRYREPKNIIQLDVDRLRLKMLKKKSPQTVKHVLALLRRIVNFGVRKQLCEGLNFTIQMPSVNNIKTEDLTIEQLQKLLTTIDNDKHPIAGAMMKMALFTGMRRGEMFKLKWDDINFERGFIHIRDPKGGPDQMIPLNDAARGLLESIERHSQFVFPGLRGSQRVNIGKQVAKIRDNAGLPKEFRPLHGLRHVYASMLASSGKVDIYTLQKLLTHKSPQMTQRYAHLRDEALKRASTVATDLIKKVTKQDSRATL